MPIVWHPTIPEHAVSQQETPDLSRRERQIMDFLFRVGRASAADVLAGIPDPPSYSAVRALLRILEDKGHVRHEEEGRAYIYSPTTRKEAARKSALQHLLRTFFDGSTEDAVAALLDLKGPRMSEEELERIERLVEQARREGR
jgi:predicted transcriptional regulator